MFFVLHIKLIVHINYDILIHSIFNDIIATMSGLMILLPIAPMTVDQSRCSQLLMNTVGNV
jgi:hypothetical protein